MLTVRHSIDSDELTKLTQFMLAMVYLLGSAWVFLDFGIGMQNGGVSIPYQLIGLVYVTPVVIGSLLPARWPRLPEQSLIRLLYRTLAVTLAFAVGLGAWYASICFLSPDVIRLHRLDVWTVRTLWIVAGIGGLVFGVLTFCLNRLLPGLTNEKKAQTVRSAL